MKVEIKLISNTERFKILSQPFIKQDLVALVIGCSRSNVSKKIKNSKKVDQPRNPFGSGYVAEDVIKFFNIDLEKVYQLAILEKKLNSNEGGALNGN